MPLIQFRRQQRDLVPLSEFTPAADNYSKFGECLQGAASGCGALFSPYLPFLRLCLFFIFLLVFYVFACHERLCLKSVPCGREELRVS